FWITIAAVPLLAIAAYAFPIIQTNSRTLEKSVVPKEAIKLNPEIIYPLKNYQRNGNRYLWGKNDCSTFVTDYMFASGKPAYLRLTTANLYSDATMKWHGYQQIKLTSIKPKDIIVFRYRGRHGNMQGHTGIVLSTGIQEIVVHNSLSGGGVVKNTVPEFLAIANRVASTQNGQKMIKIFSPL
ncbi:MAG: CHAP domain-containing protein, partial [Fimbriimonadaceae bacterium]